VAGADEHIDVSGMKQIKDTVGEDESTRESVPPRSGV
jgi:hypothetical protein